MDVLQFCTESNPSVYLSDTELAAGDSDNGVSEPAECFIQSALIRATTPTSGASDSGAGPALFTAKQRLSLCANAHSAMGPINCTNSAMHRGNTGKNYRTIN